MNDRSYGLAGILVSLALLSTATASRFLGDRVPFAPEASGLWDLLAFPAALFLIAAALLAVCYRWEGQARREGEAVTEPVEVPAEPRRDWTPWAAAGFLAWCALSWPSSETPHTSRLALSIVLAAAAAAFVASRSARGRLGLTTIAVGIAAAGTVVAALGANEYARSYQAGNALWRVFATFVNPDFLAGFLVLTIPVTIGACFAAPNRPARLVLGAGAALQSACLLLTQSRLGVAALAAGLILQGCLTLTSPNRPRVSRRALFGAGIACILLTLLAARPLMRRISTSGGESYSAAFRLHTWQGALLGAADRPLVGTGIGSFDTAYPRRAILQYTQHAHNSFVQLALETGFPGALLFMFVCGGLFAAAIRASRGSERTVDPIVTAAPAPRGRKRRRRDAREAPDRSFAALWSLDRAALSRGVAGALLASLIHNLFDSDLYLPANALAFGLVAGLALGLGCKQGNGKSRSRLARYAVAASALLPLAAGGQLWFSRQAARSAEELARFSSISQAEGSYLAAIRLDPSHPDLHLGLAQALAATGKSEQAEQAYREAIRVAPTGRSHYRYARFLTSQQRPTEAIAHHETAREREPGNTQNLVALGDAYRSEGRVADAERLYLDLTRRYEGPFGRLRAVPELVDWEIGEANAVLAEAAASRGDTAATASRYEAAAGILGEFWRQRSLEIAVIRVRPDVRRRTMDRYAGVLGAWSAALRKLGQEARSNEAEARLAEFQREREEFLGPSQRSE